MLARRALQLTAKTGRSSAAGGSLPWLQPHTLPEPNIVASASFSTSSAALAESKARRKARLTRKAHQDKKLAQHRLDEQTKPDPILGYSRDQRGQFSAQAEDEVWNKSLLKQVILDREAVWSTPAPTPGEPYTPTHLNFRLQEGDLELLSNTLPAVSSLRTLLGVPLSNASIADRRAAQSEVIEADKREKLMRIIDLRNADSKGIDVENKRRIARAFSRDGQTETDTGLPEVQAAILTYRIRSLLTHLAAMPRDIQNRRPLRSLVHQRARILRYLRAIDVKRYDECLTKIGVVPRAVEGEVVMTKKGMRELVRGV